MAQYSSSYTGAQIDSAARETVFNNSIATGSTVANMASTSRINIITVTDGTSQTLSFSSALAAGREIQIIIKANGVKAQISIPHDGSTWFNTVDGEGKTMEVASGKLGEINVINAGTTSAPKYYVRYVGA
jgi:hypothetical protein